MIKKLRYIWHINMGNLETIELLIEKGASVNAVTTDNKTPLHLAYQRGEFENSRFTNRDRSIC
jgi:ankyrin repeat protein